MPRVKYVITVPHAACPDHSRSHPCDYAAPRAAEYLATYLGVEKIIRGSIPRAVIDMNRSPSRGVLPERQELAAFVNAEPNAVVLDVHSYDEHAPWGQSSDVVFMDTGLSQKWVKVAVLHAQLKSGIRAELLAGSQVNDIMGEMKERGVPAVLIEFREGLDEALMARVAKGVADGVSYAFEPLRTKF